MIPIKTDLRLKNTPYANYILIALNVLIFFASYSPTVVRHGLTPVINPLRDWADIYVLDSSRPQIWQFLTYGFLHANYQHIIGNMFFLYLFGNNVNDKLGNVGYTSFYIAGCIFSGVGYSLLNDTPVLGASGAVSAVTGAYLVLFPRSTVTVLYWFILIGTIEVPALWFILLKMVIIDNVIQAQYSTGSVAYDAHLAGYAFGIGATFLLLAGNLLKSDKKDLFYMFVQWNRRRKFKGAMQAGNFDPKSGISVDKVSADRDLSPEDAQKQQQIYNKRAEIFSLLAASEISSAMDKYLELLKIDKEQVLPLRHQLDISNQLMSAGLYKQAAQAYEKFIANYKQYEHIGQIELMLGILYARYLEQKENGAKHLTNAKDKLSDPEQRQMCENELKKIK